MKKRDFGFKFKRKQINLRILECENILDEFIGLMFKKKSPPILFNLKNKPIHSFFCKKFIGIWFYKKKIIEVKLISPWIPFIKPNKKFDKLLEIPENNPNFKKILKLINN